MFCSKKESTGKTYFQVFIKNEAEPRPPLATAVLGSQNEAELELKFPTRSKWSHDGQDSVLLGKKKLELAVRFFEENGTRTTLPESFIVGRCLIFELELDIDLESKVLIGTKRASKNWET